MAFKLTLFVPALSHMTTADGNQYSERRMSAFALSHKTSRYLDVLLCVCQDTLISERQQAKR